MSEAKWDKVFDLLRNGQEKLFKIQSWYTQKLATTTNMLEKDSGIALALGLLDVGSFRIGNPTSSKDEDPSFGLSQLRQSHLTSLTPEEAVFVYRSKKGAKEIEPTIQKKIIKDKLLVQRIKDMKEATESNFSCGTDESDKNLFCFIDDKGENKELNTGHVNAKMKELGTIASPHNFRHVNATKTLARVVKSGGNFREGMTEVAKQLGHMRIINDEKVFDVGNTAETNYILPQILDEYGKGHYGRNKTYTEMGGTRDQILRQMRTETSGSVWKTFLTQAKTPIIKVNDYWQIS